MASKSDIVETPLMKQYLGIKKKYPDAILLFRVGDFYETFAEDAIKVSGILGITLTRRANGAASSVELAGFPTMHLIPIFPSWYGQERVAVCDQLEDPKLTKTIVKRGVTELVTPGISINDNILDRAENNFLAAVHLDTKACGLALLDISTGEFLTAEGAFDYIDKLLAGFKPKEVLFEKGKKRDFQEKFGTRYYSYPLDDWAFAFDSSRDKLLKHFETSSLKGFGVEDMKLGITASGAILQYLELTQHHQISHINRLSRIEEDKYVWLDKFTVRNLELFRSVSEGGYSLIDVIDRTITPMGSRMLKRWVALPLKDVQAVTDRHAVVEHFFRSPELKDELRRLLYPVGDLERLVSKIATGRISPREMMQLRHALYNIGPIRELTMSADNEVLRRMGEQLDECRSIREKIEREIEPDPR